MIRQILIFSLLSTVACMAQAKTLDEVIEKARAYVGPEDTVASVEALSYTGTLTPAEDGEERTVRLILEKPARQLLVIEKGDGRVTMIVNDLEGFMVQENLETGGKRVDPLPVDQVRRFKANAAENLYFYEFPPGRQVRAKYLGEQEFRGETVDAVRFIHPGNVTFFRYFDPETGRLVGTLTDTGTVNTEEGEMLVDGLRFAGKVLSFEDGEKVHTIEFSRIEVNPDLPEDTFRPE